ncbi:MAG: hypothetical protein V7K26_04430 [Nostoc sp.]|uniref:hypothetical protein n=1 Tax=Nostoc sp. TaxID=1180 RepID=UPI002FEF01B0
MRNETQHYQGFVGFRCRSTQPTILLNPSVLEYKPTDNLGLLDMSLAVDILKLQPIPI